jgi:hypothetical protein
MKEYFKLRHDFDWKYWKGYFSIPKEIYEWIRCFVQRGKQGYCYRDVWSIDYYLMEIIPPMIKQLKKTTHGFPADSTEEKWNEILDNIILGFEAGKRLADGENWAMNKDTKMKVDSSGKIEFTNPWSEEQIKHFRELDEKDKKIFDEGMELFVKFFFSLWD